MPGTALEHHHMKLTTKTLLCALGILLAGCKSYRESVRDVSHGVGAITIRDIHEADTYRKVLPDHLGISAEQVRVEPGSGVTHVTILGITSDTERQRIAGELATLSSKNPQLNPLKWTFQ